MLDFLKTFFFSVSGFKPACHTPVKVPTRRSAVESFEISATAAANHGNVSRKSNAVTAAPHTGNFLIFN